MAPENNPAEDRYNPPGNLSQDFEKFKFSDLEVNDLFWQTSLSPVLFILRKILQFTITCGKSTYIDLHIFILYI